MEIVQSQVVTTTQHIEPASIKLNGIMAEKHIIEQPKQDNPNRVQWAYGITTVSNRFTTLLPKTIANLKRGGFPNPVLYADNCSLSQALELERCTNLRVVPRQRYSDEREGVSWANYLLALYDLMIRNRNANRFILFQDDISCVTNLNQYLSSLPLGDNIYWNLYTGNVNENIAKIIKPSNGQWFKSDQLGRGALALVFTKDAVEDLLANKVTVLRTRSAKRNWHKNIDGWICEVLINQLKKYTEYCHYPSLVQHMGFDQTSLSHMSYTPTKMYPGDGFDALELLKK